MLLWWLAGVALAAPPDPVVEYAQGRSALPSADPDAVYTGAVPGSCGPLPDALPAGFEAQWHRTVLPRGSSGTEVVFGVTGSRCRIVRALLFVRDPPAVDCRVVDAAGLDRIWREIRPLYADGFEVRPGEVSPHVGSRTLVVRWDGGSCEVHDGSQAQVVDRERFDAIGAALTAQ